ncbi:YecA family protein [Noviherbaspirillum sp. ST9]|uniref:YecA family protein n=1 Tax=Noviherbaspirillum sp. ST9 TaxID=3401606 RepID=UPI003B589D6F
MAKIGRNHPCPCGSGKKFKRCHGAIRNRDPGLSPELIAYERRLAQIAQRERQQGLGRPIISGELGGRRIVAVKNRLLHSEGWKTFHDFLFEYIKIVLGRAWGNAEIAKPLADRHPILQWYDRLCRAQAACGTPGKISEMPANGAVMAYLLLAYDLYALDHNAELQEKLVNRLRRADQFLAARYEVFVAAALIRAGFTIEFEDEDDRSTSHCEFVATYIKTGKKFSVEAKCRAENGKFRLGKQLCRALKKSANHERIVFIELNIPDTIGSSGIPRELESAIAAVQAFEGRKIDGQVLPSAYVVITNSPWHYHLEEEQVRFFAGADGFQIPDFGQDVPFPSLRDAINAREKHCAIFAIMDSLRQHRNPPATFDGEIPEFAFGNADDRTRLLIGQRYTIPGPDGACRVGVLTSALVDEAKSVAMAAFYYDDGGADIQSVPLTAAELNAWRQHPNTFFGRTENSPRIEDPLDLYDFMLTSYSKTPAERLLECLANAPDVAQLRGLSQPQLASIYAERMALAAWARMHDRKAAGTNE